MNALAGRIGATLANPLLVRELRAGTRGARFFFVHLSVMALFAAIFLITLVVWVVESREHERLDPTRIGRAMYLISQVIQLVGVYLLVPAFAATSLTTERERGTYDALMSTSMSPLQVAWGKLEAAVIEVALLFVSLIPIVALSSLFGGVTARQVLLNYAFLGVHAVVLAVWALAISASVRSTLRAVIGSYFGALLCGLVLFILIFPLEGSGVGPNFWVGYGFFADVAEANWGWRGPHVFSPLQVAVYVYTLPLFLAGLVVAGFFTRTVVRLKPFFEDKVRPFRWLFLVALSGTLALAYAIYRMDFVTKVEETNQAIVGMVAGVLAVIGTLGTIFVCEDPVLPEHTKAQYRGASLRMTVRRFLMPGAPAAALFVNVMMLLGVVTATVLFAPCAKHLNTRFKEWSMPMSVILSIGTVVPWTFFLTGVAGLLAVTMRRWPTLVRVLVLSIGIAFLVLPLLHALLEGQGVAFLSPLTSIVSALHEEKRSVRPWGDTSFFGTRVHSSLAFIGIMMLLGAVLHGAAWTLHRRRRGAGA